MAIIVEAVPLRKLPCGRRRGVLPDFFRQEHDSPRSFLDYSEQAGGFALAPRRGPERTPELQSGKGIPADYRTSYNSEPIIKNYSA